MFSSLAGVSGMMETIDTMECGALGMARGGGGEVECVGGVEMRYAEWK